MDKRTDANLFKKYHQTLVYDYTEYPTKGNWSEDFGSEDYSNIMGDWLKLNPEIPILFYVHTPFCEELCYFCLCSKEITRDYEKVKNYLYDYLFKEIDLLKELLKKNEISLNVQEIYFGGGSPTYFKNKEFKNLIEKLNGVFDFDKIDDFTIEVDPRRVDEEKLLFYNSLGVNRLSFGVQDFDLNVQKRINRIQPAELLHDLLTEKVRSTFKTFNFDLLVGLPGQTVDSLSNTLRKVIDLKPPQVQPMMMHFKPQTRNYMIHMLKDGPLPDFFDRKVLYQTLDDYLTDAGYTDNGYESYALPNDELSQAIDEKKAFYASLGVQKGAATSFVAIGSSGHGCLGDDYYFQNYYEQDLYKKSLSKNEFPVYRGIKLDEDDKKRRQIIKTLRTYFEYEFLEFNEESNETFQNYFEKELVRLTPFIDDKLVEMNSESMKITENGKQFSPQIINAFDRYNPQEYNVY